MNRGIVAKVTAFGIDVVRGREEGETEYEAGITEGRDPNWAHPGGYS